MDMTERLRRNQDDSTPVVLAVSAQIVWRLAAIEALNKKSQEIDPDHFFLALLKFSEFEAADLKKVVDDKAERVIILQDLHATSAILQVAGISSKNMRRALRRRLPVGEGEYDDGVIHRSEGSKRLFARAGLLASEQGENRLLGSQHLTLELLRHPGVVMAELMAPRNN